ncbi:MAG: trypsin-like serine protease [Oligoflexales bacterium]
MKITNGVETSTDEYPSVVNVYATVTALSPRMVLGAAHSVIEPLDRNDPNLVENGLQKRTPGPRYRYLDPVTGKNLQPIVTFAHPGADGKVSGWDLAIAIFDRDVFQGPFASISDRPAEVGDEITIVGYGLNNLVNNTGFGTKRKGNNTIDEVAPTGLLNFSGEIQNTEESGGTGENSSSGSGDSGGPAFAKDTTKLVGVTSGGLIVDDKKISRYVNLHSQASKLFFVYLTRLGINIPLPDGYISDVENIPMGEYVDMEAPGCKVYVSSVQRDTYSADLRDRHFFIFKQCGKPFYKADLVCNSTRCRSQCDDSNCEETEVKARNFEYKAFEISGDPIGSRRFTFVEKKYL